MHAPSFLRCSFAAGQSRARRDVVVEPEHIGRVVLRLQRRQPLVRRRLVGCAARLWVGDRQEVEVRPARVRRQRRSDTTPPRDSTLVVLGVRSGGHRVNQEGRVAVAERGRVRRHATHRPTHMVQVNKCEV